jgi:putative glutamine amidotransferase
MTQSRPRIAILGRFAESTSVTRYAGLVNARRLIEGIWAAGGEPLTLLPVADSDWSTRLAGISGIVMPGGSDVNPERYGQKPASEELYGIDDLQDEVDISLVKYALEHGIPVLSICRGFQITNVALGGTLVQDMQVPHRHHVAPVTIEKYASDLGLSSARVEASCYHHQIIDEVADGVEVIGRSAEGHIEAVKYPAKGWAYGVQWHPEDNFDTNAPQLDLFKALVREAGKFMQSDDCCQPGCC